MTCLNCSGAATPNGAMQTRDPAARGATAAARGGLAVGAAARAHRLPPLPRALAHTPPRHPPAIPRAHACLLLERGSVCERLGRTLIARSELNSPPAPRHSDVQH